MARRTTDDPIEPELNLAPIMNMVMILIPLLLVMVEFEEFAISPVEATSSGGASSGDTSDSDEVRPPRLLISISEDGFRIADFFASPDFAEFAKPISRCAGAGAEGAAGPPTVCLEPDKSPEPGDYSGLDYAGLYNRLVEIRLHSPWKEAYGKPENSVILLTAESDVPAAVLIRSMDLARFFLDPSASGGLTDPLSEGVSDISPYLLGGADADATREDLLQAEFLFTDNAGGLNRDKEGHPSNILPMFPSVSIVSPR